MKLRKKSWLATLWRRVIVLGLLSSLLTGCRPFEIMDGPDMEYHGEDNVPTVESKPESIGDFDGTWLTRDGSIKLVIRDGEVELYWKDDETGRYRQTGTCKMAFDENGDRVLRPEKGETTTPNPMEYSVIDKKGDLIYAAVPTMDAAMVVEVFAMEGHEDDLPT